MNRKHKNTLNMHIKVSYDCGGYNVMTLKRVLNKYKHAPESLVKYAKEKILSGEGWRFDGAFYSITDEQITVL